VKFFLLENLKNKLKYSNRKARNVSVGLELNLNSLPEEERAERNKRLGVRLVGKKRRVSFYLTSYNFLG